MIAGAGLKGLALLVLLGAWLQVAVDPEVWAWVRQIALILAAVGGGGGVVWAVNRVKSWLGLSGAPALLLSAVVALVVAVAELIVAGQLAPETIAVENLSSLVLLVWVTSQEIYRRINGSG